MVENTARGDQQGFTLIELVTVVLVLAVLLAIAVPVFLGVRERSQERAAQSHVREALLAAHAYFAEHQTYSTGPSGDEGPAVTALNGMEPSLTFQAAASTGSKIVRVRVDDTSGTVVTNGKLCLTVLGDNGVSYTVRHIAAGDNAGTAYREGGMGMGCPGNPIGVNGWRPSW